MNASLRTRFGQLLDSFRRPVNGPADDAIGQLRTEIAELRQIVQSKSPDSLRRSPTNALPNSGASGDAIEQLRLEVAELRSVVLSQRQIDLVDFGELRVFMYVDDLAYQQLGDQYKHQRSCFPKRDLSVPRRTPQDRYASPGEPLIPTLLSHHWVNELDFTYFDIGCQYGTSAMSAAQTILATGQRNHVFAFDPGVAGQLARYNMLLNNFEDRVTFERVAISHADFPSIVFTELGRSENNRVVNRYLPSESLSYVTMCRSVDSYIAEKGIKSDHIVAKIDTQGGEVEVFQGMSETLRTRHVTCLTEFVPGAIETRTRPDEWLSELSKTFSLFEIRELDLFLSQSHKVHLLPEETVPDFVREVTQRATPSADLLLVPRGLRNHDTLLQKLS